MLVTDIKTDFKIRDIAVLLGGGNNSDLSHATRNKVQYWSNKLNFIIEPQIIYRIQKITHISDNSVYLAENLKFNSQKLTKVFSGCNEAVCFLATIGSRIERDINRLMGFNRASEAYVLDAIGSATVENLVINFQKRFASSVERRDKTTTLRFSPGYCDWPVTEQKKLFKLLDSNQLGLELTESCHMKPRKSISGVFGLKSRHGKSYNPCFECKNKSCHARRS